MGEIYRLNLDRLIRALGLKENLDRSLLDRGVVLTIDVSQYLDQALGAPGAGAAGGSTNFGVSSPLIRIQGTPVVTVGTDWSITVPDGVRWKILYLSARLVTSAAVANRLPNMTMTTPIPSTMGCIPAFVQAASLTVNWKWFNGAPDFSLAGTPAGTVNDVAYPPGLTVLGGFKIGPITQNLQVADQWDQVACVFEETPL